MWNLHHAAEQRARKRSDAVDAGAQEQAVAAADHDPADYSALGGPEDERAYGRSRALNGDYPYNALAGAYDRDDYAPLITRGGLVKRPHAGGPITDIAHPQT